MIRMPVVRVRQVDELRLLSFQQRPHLRCGLFDRVAKEMVGASQKRYFCHSKNSRRLFRFGLTNGPCFLPHQIVQGEFSRGQKYSGHVIAANSMKTDAAAATDRLVVRMGGNNKNIHLTFPFSLWTLSPKSKRE